MSTRRLNDLKEQIALSGNIRDAAWFTQQYQNGRIKLLVKGKLLKLNKQNYY